jgi:hypothetical protein
MEGMTAMTDPSLLPSSSGVDADEPYGGRDPARELYAHAAGVLENAQALEAAASDPATVAALAPTLACFETSLAALAQATSQLRVHALRRLTDPVLANYMDLGRHRAEIAAALERLTGVLDQGSFACTRTREAIEPVNFELTAL